MNKITKPYRHIYICDTRDNFKQFRNYYSIKQDLVLTFDFGLKHYIESLDGNSLYIDCLCTADEMQKNNLTAAEFLKKWNYDKENKDIFTAQGIPFGFSFRIEFWSEYLYYVRLRASLEKLRKATFSSIMVCENNFFVAKILTEIGMSFEHFEAAFMPAQMPYFFDIHRYMRDALHGKSIKNFMIKVLTWSSSIILYYLDSIFHRAGNRKAIYLHIYHPTKPLFNRLQSKSNLRIVTSSVAATQGVNKYLKQRLIPVRGKIKDFDKFASLLFKRFTQDRTARFILNDGTDITLAVFDIIDTQIKCRISESLRFLNSVLLYIRNLPIDLEVMIANLGVKQVIVDCVLKSKGIPSFLIINGLMTSKHGDEAKYASYVNCYGASLKSNYFDNANNVICLGDPRMDCYINSFDKGKKIINRNAPIVGIGTSGFNNIDLISHVAVEFDFMFDILTAFQQLKEKGQLFRLIIKVRPNGVLKQYISFADEYFADLDIQIVRDAPMISVLKKIDLYISIYSQTLFEASCLGIPTIYYKKDREYLNPPFDMNSELVTINTVEDLIQAFFDFKASDQRFDSFLEKTTMEKYIGPLDGKNTERNLNFIYHLLQSHDNGDSQ